jgi:AhpD family alkylhydroperoxidase
MRRIVAFARAGHTPMVYALLPLRAYNGPMEAGRMVDPHDWIKAKSVQKLKELQPELFEKFVELDRAVYEPGHLSTKIKEIIAVAVTHVTQCDACTALHTRNAKLAGATDAEIAEAVFVAMTLRAGAAIGHFKTTAAALEHTHG